MEITNVKKDFKNSFEKEEYLVKVMLRETSGDFIHVSFQDSWFLIGINVGPFRLHGELGTEPNILLEEVTIHFTKDDKTYIESLYDFCSKHMFRDADIEVKMLSASADWYNNQLT